MPQKPKVPQRRAATKREDGKSIHPAMQYAEDVLAGRVVAGKLVRQAVERHFRDLDHGADRGLRFDEQAGQHVIDLYHKYLRHSKGEWAGRPLWLEPWQQWRKVVKYGWLRADGTRRFRSGYTEVARKNGKSTDEAGEGIYLFMGDGEPGAEVYTLATKIEQARVVHGEAIRMLKAAPALRKHCTIYRTAISSIRSNSKFEPLGSNSETLDGTNPSAGICDEVHAWPNAKVYDVVLSGMGTRRQPLMDAITTAGRGQESFCRQLHNDIRAILDASNGLTVDDSFGIIYTLDDGDDWKNPECWIKANPNLGISVKLDFLKENLAKALRMPTFENEFKQKFLNLWVEQAVREIPMNLWDAAPCDVKPEDLEGKECWAGLDVATTTDIAAIELAFPLSGKLAVLSHFFCPGHTAGLREQRQRGLYKTWAKAGLMEETAGRAIDYEYIKAKFRTLAQRFKIRACGYDPYNAHQMAMELAAEGFKMIEIRQGVASMHGPTKEFLRLVQESRLVHFGHRVLRWMASNLAVRRMGPQGNLMPDKERSGDKIDGIVALVIALAVLGLEPVKRKSVYETRGPLVMDLY